MRSMCAIDLRSCARRTGVVLRIVEQRRGLGMVDVVVQIEVSRGRHPAAVGRLVLAHEHEGFSDRVRLSSQSISEVRYDVRAVALRLAHGLPGVLSKGL